MPIMKLPSTYHSLACEPQYGALCPTRYAGNTRSISTKAVPPVPSAAFTTAARTFARLPPQPAPPHTYTFSSSHTKPSTLNFQLVNLLARFPNRWQVSRMRQISISSPILQNTRALEEACSQPRSEIKELRGADGCLDLPKRHPPALRPGWDLPF